MGSLPLMTCAILPHDSNDDRAIYTVYNYSISILLSSTIP